MPMPPPSELVIWRLTDGKPGHEKQTRGLADALARLTPTQCHDIRVGKGTGQILNALLGRFPQGQGLPAPHLILAAGHATHIPLLAARRAWGGKSVVLMRPSLPLAWFDLCLIPAHDTPPARANVVVTRGVLNTLTDRKAHDPACGLFLIGGPSPHFVWDGASVLAQIRSVLDAHPDMRWTLTNSRRTPGDFLVALLPEHRVKCFAADATPPGWLEEELARSGKVWCTPDSVSMVYEALTAGCRVGLLDLPAVVGSRVAAGVAKLVGDGYVEPFREKPPGCAAAAAGLNESERCAKWILESMFP